MANIKSAKKRILVIEKKTLRNKMIKSQVKTAVKKVLSAIEAKDAAAAKESLTYIGICLCGALTTVCFTLVLDKFL